MTLQQKLDACKANFKERVAPEAVEVMHRATEVLRASGLAGSALKVGDGLPDFTLPAAGGELVRTQDLLARGPLVVSFYRGVW